MNSNNYNSGIELNVSIVSIISAIYQHIPYDRHTCINHEKYYDVIDYTDGTYRGELPNSGYVMPTHEAEARCRYLHDKYRKVEQEFGLVRDGDYEEVLEKAELDLEGLLQEEVMMVDVYLRRGVDPTIYIEKVKEQAERFRIRNSLIINGLL